MKNGLHPLGEIIRNLRTIFDLRGKHLFYRMFSYYNKNNFLKTGF